ncbi:MULTISPECIES: hypothetical protein [unclassified Moraxella]|uniref:hypothetical protein n=1 Tax=unclassified Moraxella TaxID=2685852 RepID=UPI002B401113|nr:MULTISPECIES: hypothetical protein [unclassified Moraxella]
MQTIGYNELQNNLDKAWQSSKNEPVIIREQGENVRVLLSFDEFLALTSTKPKTNADKIAMSLDDLAKLDDDIHFGFDEIAQEVVL